MQERAGVRGMATRVGQMIDCEVPLFARDFLYEQPVVVISSVGANARVWASLITAEPGFMRVPDERTIVVDAPPVPGDPLDENLRYGARLGLLAIDFATGRRMKAKGVVARVLPEGGFELRTERVYALCPKYIQARTWEPGGGPVSATTGLQRSGALTEDQRGRVAQADTFFVASFHPETGADASHRGGMPGFVEILDEETLAWPDYSGNRMFNTLGNLTENPNAGLLFVDFESGHTLQMSGEAEVDWDEERAARFVGAERVVEFRVREVISIQHASALRWRLWGYSAFNPR